MTKRSDISRLTKQAVEQGFTVERSKSGHWKITNPNTGRMVFIPSTPSDWRAVLNAASTLKKIGFEPRKDRAS